MSLSQIRGLAAFCAAEVVPVACSVASTVTNSTLDAFFAGISRMPSGPKRTVLNRAYIELDYANAFAKGLGSGLISELDAIVKMDTGMRVPGFARAATFLHTEMKERLGTVRARSELKD